jgi:hypothetical protein
MPPAYVASPHWYYMLQGQRQGPIEQVVFQQLIASGRVGFDDMVWREGMGQWAAAGTLPELSPMFAQLNYARSANDIGQDAGMRLLIPVGRSGWAIAAGYLGLLSVLIVPSPLALIFSIIAIRHIRKDQSVHGMGRAIFGLVMGGLGTAVMVIGVVAAIWRR